METNEDRARVAREVLERREYEKQVQREGNRSAKRVAGSVIVVVTALCALGTWQQFRNGEVYDLGFAVLFVVWPITLVGALTVLYLFTSD